MRKKAKKKINVFPYVMTSPTILLLVFLTVFPLLFNVYFSFTDYYFLSPGNVNLIGIKNYVNTFRDIYFQQALFNTFKFTVLAVISETLFGLVIALFINSLKTARKSMRTIFLLPTLLPPVTVALIWQIMFSNNYGIINKMLGYIGIDEVNWLMDVRTAFYSILVIDIWQYVPFTFLLIYASLQTVPKTQYEAATIDGAGFWQQFIYVTLPNIFNGIVMVVLLRTIDTFRLFDKVNILTKGGPANSTATITQYIYQYGVKGLKVGYGSAGAVIMTVLILILASLYVKKSFEKKI
jgi:multiple sugar transport system permease protein